MVVCLMNKKNGRCERLGKKQIRMTQEQYYACQHSEKTYAVVKRPFSERFAYWAGKNNKQLFQLERLDDASARAYALGWQEMTNKMEN